MGVAGWGCPISINVVWIGTAFLLLVNKVPRSTSMAHAITLRMMENSTQSVPLGSGITAGGLVGSCVWVTKKNNPPARLRTYEQFK